MSAGLLPDDPSLGGVLTPAEPRQLFDPRLPRQGFLGNVADTWHLNESVQGARFLFESAMPAEEGFDPLTPDNLKGMEQWAPWLAEARSSQQLAAIKGRIVENEERRDRLSRDGGILSALVGTAGAPENLASLFLPGLGGAKIAAGAASHAARTAGVFGAVATATSAVGLRVDPTYERSEVLTNVLAATVLGGVLGGVLGAAGARTINHYADAFVNEQRIADAVFAENGPLATAERSGGRYEARPTTPELQPGYKSMFGLENVISAPGLVDGKITNPLFNPVAGLVQSGVQALQDLGLRIGGDFGLILKANTLEPTRASAALRAGQWEAHAADTDQGLFRAWQAYLGRETPRIIAGMDVTGIAERTKDFASKILGGRRDGKLTFGEFREAVLDARRNGGKADLERLKDTSEQGIHAIETAQRETLAPFFERMLKEGTAVNYLKTTEGTARRYAELLDEWRRTVALEADASLPQTARNLIARKKEHLAAELTHLEQSGVRGPTPPEVTLRPTPPETTLGPETAPPFANDPGVAPTPPSGAGVAQAVGRAADGQPVSLRAANDAAPREHTYDPFYAPRLWNKEAVEARRAELHTIIREKWEGPDPVPDAEAIEKMIDGLVVEEGHSFGGERAGAFFRHGRVIQVPDRFLQPWLENDPSVLVRTYGSRFGAGVEMQRAFGQRSGQLSIFDALIQAAREGKTAEELRTYEDMIEYLRASVLGDLHLGLPTTATAVMVDTAKNAVSTMVMGGTWLQQVMETLRIPMAHGFGRTFGFLYDGMLGNMEGFRKLTAENRAVVADLWDVARGTAAQRWTEMGGPHANGTPLANAINRTTQPFNEFVRGPYWLMNGMAQITDMQKTFTAAAASHFLIEDMQALVAGTAKTKIVQNLNALGIGDAEARLILSMPLERSGTINVPAMSVWGEGPAASEARALFAAAIRGDINRVITTPSAATRSPMAQGFFHMSDDARRHFALVTLPFQFMSWGMAALSKVTGSALQGRDANAMVGIAGLMGAAYLANWFKSSDSAWERQPTEERWLRAVEGSGVGGILTSLPGLLERATYGHVGPRPMLGLPPRYGSEYTDYDALSVPFGPVGAKATDLWRIFMDPTLPEGERRGKAHRLVPLADLPYVPNLLRAAETWGLSP